MAISDQEFSNWLKLDSPALRNILFEPVGLYQNVETTFYLTQKAYKNYDAVLAGGLEFSKKITVPEAPSNDGLGTASLFTLSVGEALIDNESSRYDYWLRQVVFENRPYKLLIGDVSWDRADYRTILTGVINTLTAKTNRQLSFVLQDKLQYVNAPVTELLLGGTTANKDAIIPFVIGEVFNMSPLLGDPTTYKYYVHPILPIEDVIEVRDDEGPVLVTKTVSTGSFDMVTNANSTAPKGTVTCDVQGHKPGGVYTNKIGSSIRNLVTQAGAAATRLTDADIDLQSIADADTVYPHPIGYTNSQKDNILTCIQLLASSVGMTCIMSIAGKLKLVDLVFRTPVASVTATDMEPNSLKPVKTYPIAGAVKLGYCRNWTLQDKNKTYGIPEAHKDIFATEWRTVTVKSQTIIDKFKLTATPVLEGTLLLTPSDATTEANRRLTFRSTRKVEYSFVGYSSCFMFELGSTITVTHKDYGMTNGVPAIVTGMAYDFSNYVVTVTVLINEV